MQQRFCEKIWLCLGHGFGDGKGKWKVKFKEISVHTLYRLQDWGFQVILVLCMRFQWLDHLGSIMWDLGDHYSLQPG